jgi:serine/threonine protein kinase
VLVDQDGSVKIADFGIAKVTDEGTALTDRNGPRHRSRELARWLERYSR